MQVIAHRFRNVRVSETWAFDAPEGTDVVALAEDDPKALDALVTVGTLLNSEVEDHDSEDSLDLNHVIVEAPTGGLPGDRRRPQTRIRDPRWPDVTLTALGIAGYDDGTPVPLVTPDQMGAYIQAVRDSGTSSDGAGSLYLRVSRGDTLVVFDDEHDIVEWFAVAPGVYVADGWCWEILP